MNNGEKNTDIPDGLPKSPEMKNAEEIIDNLDNPDKLKTLLDKKTFNGDTLSIVYNKITENAVCIDEKILSLLEKEVEESGNISVNLFNNMMRVALGCWWEKLAKEKFKKYWWKLKGSVSSTDYSYLENKVFLSRNDPKEFLSERVISEEGLNVLLTAIYWKVPNSGYVEKLLSLNEKVNFDFVTYAETSMGGDISSSTWMLLKKAWLSPIWEDNNTSLVKAREIKGTKLTDEEKRAVLDENKKQAIISMNSEGGKNNRETLISTLWPLNYLILHYGVSGESIKGSSSEVKDRWNEIWLEIADKYRSQIQQELKKAEWKVD